MSTHRLAYELTYGAIPDGMLVLHKCDNRPCVRPDHLFLGTHEDNTRDAIQKHRHHFPETYSHPVFGEATSNSKLTADQVREIRQRHTQNEGYGRLARTYGVDKRTIALIIKRHTWKEVA